MDSQTKIEKLQEDGIPVLLEIDNFKPFNKLKVTSCILSPLSTLPKHINTLPRWSHTLIRNYRDEALGPSLLKLIQTKSEITIASNGSKSNSESGGAWIISDSSGNIFTSGSNPDFGSITSINSHRSEIYAVLSALLFLHKYCRYFMLRLSSPVKYFCDNIEVVNKMKQLITDEKYYDEYIQTADHEAVHLLKKYLPSQFFINQVRSHQDKRKKKCNLITAERLNIAADELVGFTSSRPINSHINTPFAIYIDGNYIPNHYRNKIRSTSGANEAREFLKEKYQ